MQHASGLVRYVWLDHNAACVGTDRYLDAAGVDDKLGLSGVQPASVLQRSIFELDIFGTHPDYAGLQRTRDHRVEIAGFNARGISVRSRHLGRDERTRESCTESWLRPTPVTVFSFTIRCADGYKFGAVLSELNDNCLLVHEVDPDGAVGSWNRLIVERSPEKVIRPGDKITKVNGISCNSKAMLLECLHRPLVRLTLVRTDVTPPASRGGSVQLRAGAQQFVPMAQTHDVTPLISYQ